MDENSPIFSGRWGCVTCNKFNNAAKSSHTLRNQTCKNNCGKSYKHTSSKVVVFFLNKRAQIKLNISDVT